MSNLDEQINALIAENEALKCQVSLIRSAWNAASLDVAALFRTQPQNQEDGSYAIDGQDCNDLTEIISKTPAQCLNSIKADAIDAAADELDTNINYSDACHSCVTQNQLIDYANKLRNSDG